MKKISVIIPNYNYANYIEERIDSILNQTYKIHELIILDDCSTDESVKVIENRIKNIKDIKVKFIKNKENTNSVFSQWQLGLKNVTGDYFWIAEADDLCNKDFLKEAISFFEKNKNIILFYSDSKKIDSMGNVFDNNLKDYMDIFKTGKWDKSYINSGIDEIKECLSNNNTILNVSSVVWKNSKIYFEIFEKAKKYKVAGDWYIYYRVLEHGDIAFSNKSLNCFRKHTDSVSSKINPNIEYKEVYEIQEEIREKYKLSKEVLEKQIQRRRFMGFCENNSFKGKNGNIAFICGKYNNRLNFKKVNKIIEAFLNKDYKCDVYFKDSLEYSPIDILKKLNISIDVFTDIGLNKKYKAIIYIDDKINIEYEAKKIYLASNIIKAQKLKRNYNCKILYNKIDTLTDFNFDNIIYIIKIF